MVFPMPRVALGYGGSRADQPHVAAPRTSSDSLREGRRRALSGEASLASLARSSMSLVRPSNIFDESDSAYHARRDSTASLPFPSNPVTQHERLSRSGALRFWPSEEERRGSWFKRKRSNQADSFSQPAWTPPLSQHHQVSPPSQSPVRQRDSPLSRHRSFTSDGARSGASSHNGKQSPPASSHVSLRSCPSATSLPPMCLLIQRGSLAQRLVNEEREKKTIIQLQRLREREEALYAETQSEPEESSLQEFLPSTDDTGSKDPAPGTTYQGLPNALRLNFEPPIDSWRMQELHMDGSDNQASNPPPDTSCIDSKGSPQSNDVRYNSRTLEPTKELGETQILPMIPPKFGPVAESERTELETTSAPTTAELPNHDVPSRAQGFETPHKPVHELGSDNGSRATLKYSSVRDETESSGGLSELESFRDSLPILPQRPQEFATRTTSLPASLPASLSFPLPATIAQDAPEGKDDSLFSGLNRLKRSVPSRSSHIPQAQLPPYSSHDSNSQRAPTGLSIIGSRPLSAMASTLAHGDHHNNSMIPGVTRDSPPPSGEFVTPSLPQFHVELSASASVIHRPRPKEPRRPNRDTPNRRMYNTLPHEPPPMIPFGHIRQTPVTPVTPVTPNEAQQNEVQERERNEAQRQLTWDHSIEPNFDPRYNRPYVDPDVFPRR